MIHLSDIHSAAKRIGGYVAPTPLARSRSLSERFNTNVYLKYELFQKTGSFKPRGAFNTMLSLSDAERSRGVVGFSGGNFAQGMAYAGNVLEVETLVLMPESTPANYLDATRGYGAKVELVPTVQEAIDRAATYADDGRTLMHPFDDPRMMAGNGTLGLELLAEAPDATDVFVSVGGGGLLTGVATAVTETAPKTRMWAVETEGADVLSLSLATGDQVTIVPTSRSKTLGAPYAAQDAIDIARERVEEVLVVSDAAAYSAMRYLMERTKAVPELAASCTLAALEAKANRFDRSDHVVLVLCGGNVSAADIADMQQVFG